VNGAIRSEVVMKIVGLWRYPVKSLQGEALETIRLEDDGVVGDRRWGIRDEATGRILTARRLPVLLDASASYRSDQPVITLPDGQSGGGPAPTTTRTTPAPRGAGGAGGAPPPPPPRQRIVGLARATGVPRRGEQQ
jgi:hypothetical protein